MKIHVPARNLLACQADPCLRKFGNEADQPADSARGTRKYRPGELCRAVDARRRQDQPIPQAGRLWRAALCGGALAGRPGAALADLHRAADCRFFLEFISLSTGSTAKTR